jgi:chemotaxis response regulator CheB
VVIAGSGGSLSPLRVLVGSLTSSLDATYVCLVPFRINTLNHVADILEGAAELPVRPAENGDRLRRGQVLIASSCDGPTARIEDAVLRFSPTPPSERDAHASALTSLFASAGKSFGSSAIGIALSGPEDDGAVAARALKSAGGMLFVQSPQEAIHPRMPEAMRLEADLCAGTHELAARLHAICQTRPPLVVQAGA